MKCYYRDRIMLYGDWTTPEKLRVVLSNNEYPENAAYSSNYNALTDTTTIIINWVADEKRCETL